MGSIEARIAECFLSLSPEDYDKLDRKEPEYKALSDLWNKLKNNPEGREILASLAIGTALIDYRTYANNLWNTKLINAAKGIDLVVLPFAEVEKVLLRIPVGDRKKARLKKFIKYFVYSKDIKENLQFYIHNPISLWGKLAYFMDSRIHDKTIAFAMKAFGISCLVTGNRYSDFPKDIFVPIPIDVRIERVSRILFGWEENELRERWYKVGKILQEKSEGKLNLLRVDSFLWQLGGDLKEGMSKNETWKEVKEVFTVKKGDNNQKKKIPKNVSRFLANLKSVLEECGGG